MDGRKQVTVPETVTLGEKERKAPFPLKGKGPNDDDDDDDYASVIISRTWRLKMAYI